MAREPPFEEASQSLVVAFEVVESLGELGMVAEDGSTAP